jgi:hypothetical protein
VKEDPDDPYVYQLAQLPDLAEQYGIDYAQGADAMKMSGIPEGAEMKDWRDTSRYYNGVTDRTADGSIDGHVARHETSIDRVRSQAGMELRGTPQGRLSGPITSLE